MNICFLGDAASIHVIRWCEFFRDNGDDVSIISFRDSEIKGVRVYFIGDKISVDSKGGNYKYLKKIFIIKKLIKEIKPDIVNCHYLTSYGLIGALLSIKPLIISTWGTDILVTPNKNFIYKLLTKYIIRKSDLLTSDSKYMSSKIKVLYSKSNIITVPMGIDIDVFKSDENNIYESDIFLSMRTISKNSNIDLIVKAFKKVVEYSPKVKLIIVNEGDLKEEVLALIEMLDLKENVQYLGAISRDEVAKLLKKCSVYISIPTSDSTSVNLLEAMATGTCPIVSNLPANREWIENNRNGYILESLDEKELSEIMKRALNNIELRDNARKLNIQIIREKAIWQDNMNYVREQYIDLKEGL